MCRWSTVAWFLLTSFAFVQLEAKQASQKMKTQAEELNFLQVRHARCELCVDCGLTFPFRMQLYFQDQLLRTTMQRNLFMVDTKEASLNAPTATSAGNPEEVVRLCDLLLQNVADLAAAPSDDAEVTRSLGALHQFFVTYRCYWVAEVYASLRKWQEAEALLHRATQHASLTQQRFGECRSMEDVSAREV